MKLPSFTIFDTLYCTRIASVDVLITLTLTFSNTTSELKLSVCIVLDSFLLSFKLRTQSLFNSVTQLEIIFIICLIFLESCRLKTFQDHISDVTTKQPIRGHFFIQKFVHSHCMYHCRNGQTVAVRHVQKSHFTVTKAVRKEVKQIR